MKAVLSPSVLSGTVPAIASKSDIHRLLICAALADSETTLKLNSQSPLSDDILATAECLRELGADIFIRNGAFHIIPCKEVPDAPLLDCKESGSTLRFMLPVAAALCGAPSFTGSGRLPERPVKELLDAVCKNGPAVSAPKLPFSFSGKLQSGTFELPGTVSSQYITGLLMALPLLKGDSFIKLTTPLQSASYIDITLHALSRFGICVEKLADENGGYFVPGGQTYRSPGDVTADGDWSNAAFFLAAGAVGSKPVSVSGLAPGSPQGDKAIARILEELGADVSYEPKDNDGLCTVTVSPAPLHGTTIDLSDIPDLLPILAVTASHADGKTEFINGARLRLKESDRIASVYNMLKAIGTFSEEKPNGLTVFESKEQCGGTVDSANDHRIVMAASIAAAVCSSPVTVLDSQAVKKSYPSFFEDYNAIGGHADVI